MCLLRAKYCAGCFIDIISFNSLQTGKHTSTETTPSCVLRSSRCPAQWLVDGGGEWEGLQHRLMECLLVLGRPHQQALDANRHYHQEIRYA